MKHPSTLAIKDFTYDLPVDRIANRPLANRDDSKLLVLKNGGIEDSHFNKLAGFLPADTLLVFNDTKVIRARLKFHNNKGQAIELFCLEPADSVHIAEAMSASKSIRWNCLVGNLKQWRDGVLSHSEKGLSIMAKIVERKENFVIVDFSWSPETLFFSEVLEGLGVMPIPPYLKRESDSNDNDRYQTVYAQQKGSVAAPTAGLHFTDRTFDELKKKSIQRINVTLHVGAGTFKPVKSDTMLAHEMHSEWMEVDLKTIQQLAMSHEQTIIAVGTTSLRTIESLYWMGFKAMRNPESSADELEIKQWDAYDMPGEQPSSKQSLSALQLWMEKRNLKRIVCKTGILIAPPYALKVAKGIITNFHQPQSTLLLLIGAIIGEQWKEVYEYALKNNYRFLSYGDSSLLFK